MKEDILNAAAQWANAVQSRIPDRVIELYHPDASLWGTLSPVIRHGHEAILDYFIGFLAKDGLKCKFDEGFTRVYGDLALYSGSYTFSWMHEEKEIIVPARFSFIYKRENKRWLILEHHSSLFPELPFNMTKFIQV